MLKIKVADLKPQLKILGMIVKGPTTIPILGHIQITPKGFDKAEIRGTDLDTFYSCTEQAECTDQTAFSIDYRLLAGIVRTTEATEIEFAGINQNAVEITAGVSKWQVPHLKAEDFPELPTVPTSDGRLINADKFRKAIKCAKFAISTEHSRFTLNAAKTLIGDEIQMVTTDGHRLAYFKSVTGDTKVAMDLLVSISAMNVLEKMNTASISIKEDSRLGSYIHFETEIGVLTTRKVTGTFPNWKMVMPTEFDGEMIFDAMTMKRILDQAMISQRDVRASAIAYNISTNGLTVTASMTNGMFKADLPAAGSKDVVIGINPKLMIDFIKIIGKGEIKMSYTNNVQPIQLTAVEDLGYEYKLVLMPLRM